MIIINNKSKKIILEELDEAYRKKAISEEQLELKKKQLDALEAFYDKYRGKHVRATLFQLAKSANGDKMVFDADMKKPIRNNCLITADHFVETNWRCFESGRLLQLDVEATEEQVAKHAEWVKTNQEQAQLEQEVGNEVAQTIKAIGQAAKQKAGKTAKK